LEEKAEVILMSKKKNNDLLGFVMDNATLSAGVMVGAGAVSKIGSVLPSPMSGSIMKGMGTMSIMPTMHASSGIFNQLQSLNNSVKKKRR
jgi:hypothetical protein